MFNKASIQRSFKDAENWSENNATSENVLDHIQSLCSDDFLSLKESEKKYGNSWKRRGGVGAFMMLARKWDRIENTVEKNEFKYDIFSTIEQDPSRTGILDDIRDLRRYLFLVEAEMVRRGIIK